MAQSKSSSNGFVTAMLFLLGLLIVWLLSRNGATSSARTSQEQIITDKLLKAGYSERFAKYWVAIAKFESRNFTSLLSTKYKNLVGMSYPTVGKDYGSVTLTDAGVKKKFSVYPTFNDCLDDLIEYLQALKYEKDYATVDELIKYMKSKGYFGSPVDVYMRGVKSKLNGNG